MRLLTLAPPTHTGATRVTRTLAKKLSKRYDIRNAVIYNTQDPGAEIRSAIVRERPDLLFCSFSVINPDVILAAKENDLRVVVRCDYKMRDLAPETQRRIIQTYPSADWIIVQSEEMRQELLAFDALKDCRIKILENPIDEDAILEGAAAPDPFPENGCFHFLWVGRKDPIKDLPTLQRAFAIVHGQFPKTDLTLVSNDSNPYRWMKYADCLVISSISEASPNVFR